MDFPQKIFMIQIDYLENVIYVSCDLFYYYYMITLKLG